MNVNMLHTVLLSAIIILIYHGCNFFLHLYFIFLDITLCCLDISMPGPFTNCYNIFQLVVYFSDPCSTKIMGLEVMYIFLLKEINHLQFHGMSIGRIKHLRIWPFIFSESPKFLECFQFV